jgi:alkanesulfonate monooxygenase SsuD/methylene tetrahydromethanopterin reductase-like flavin-dependent oxidoreductase (luciferase family)
MAGTGVRFGIVLPTRDFIMRDEPDGWRKVFAVAERAEELGYESVWMGDSLVAKPRLEVFTTLAYVAAKTQRVGLGTAIYIPTLREPVQLAHSMACLDLFAGGRVTFGMGLGPKNPGGLHEYRTVGVDVERRVSRLEETLRVLRLLWTQDDVSFDGQHFHLENVTLRPRPAQPNGPRLLMTAGNDGKVTPRQARRVVELGDGMFPSRVKPDEYRGAWARVQEEAERQGRDPGTLEPALYWTVHLDDDADHAAREADEWLVGYYGLPRYWGESWGPWGPASVLRQRIDEFVEAGVRLFVVRFAAWDTLGQLERFTQQVWPHYC